MNSALWGALGLRAARLQDIERECGPFEPERQPPMARLSLVDPEHERLQTRRMVEQLRAQEPVERIVNALLLAAVQEGARRLTIEPNARGVGVSLLVGERERQHLHLPSTTLVPLVERLRSMASLPVNGSEGHLQMRVEQQLYSLRLQLRNTPWGERVEVVFALSS